VAFYHENPSQIVTGKSESEDSGKEKLKIFRDFVLDKKMCKPYSNAHQLGAVVSRSITQLKKSHPAIGWVRADSVISGDSAEEILKLRNEINSLNIALSLKNAERFAEIESFFDKNILIVCNCEVFEKEGTTPLVKKNITLTLTFKQLTLYMLPYFLSGLKLNKIGELIEEFFLQTNITVDFFETTDQHRIKIHFLENEVVRILIFFKKLEVVKQLHEFYFLTDFGEEFIATNLLFERVK
jgi:hypothetical protein